MIASAVSLLILVVLVTASPLDSRDNAATVPLARQLNVPSGKTLPEIDRARAQAFKSAASQRTQKDSGVIPVPVTDTATVYTAEVGPWVMSR